MGDHEAQGDEYVHKAEKKLKGWGFFGSKYEDAAELFDKAANSFKLGKACLSVSTLLLLVLLRICILLT